MQSNDEADLFLSSKKNFSPFLFCIYIYIYRKKKEKKKEKLGKNDWKLTVSFTVDEIRCLPVSVELLMVLFAVDMADWLVTGVPTVVAVVVEELFGERAALAAWACAWAWA